MEATTYITAKEREFIAAVEAHHNAEGKVIAWYICANGNGMVIFENATKDRYSCAHVIDMEGGYFLLFVGERAGHPYDRKTYKRKGNALKGFRMQEGHNEPPTQPATPAETPQIPTETAETTNVSAEDENAVDAKRMAAIIEPYKDIDKYALTPHYIELLSIVCRIFGISREDAREMYGLFTYRQWYDLLRSITSELPQSPETQCIGEPHKLAQTA